MKVLAFFTMMPHLLILFVSYYAHLFAMPLVKDMLAKLPPMVQQRYQENVVIIISSYTIEVFDLMFSWWFVIIPLFTLVVNLIFYLLKRTNENAAFGSVIFLVTIASMISFISMSVNSLAVFMLTANFVK